MLQGSAKRESGKILGRLKVDSEQKGIQGDSWKTYTTSREIAIQGKGRFPFVPARLICDLDKRSQPRGIDSVGTNVRCRLSSSRDVGCRVESRREACLRSVSVVVSVQTDMRRHSVHGTPGPDIR